MSLNISQSGAANFNTKQVTITTSATVIVPANSSRRGVIITNTGTTDVYIGKDNALTTSIGDLLAGVKGAFVSIPTTSQVYGIVGSGSQVVSYMEVYD